MDPQPYPRPAESLPPDPHQEYVIGIHLPYPRASFCDEIAEARTHAGLPADEPLEIARHIGLDYSE